MSLKQQLMDDLKSSMKNKDTIRKNTITLIRAAITQKEVDEKIELSDEDILSIISKQLKERRDSLKEFEKANRDDLVNTTSMEIDILLKYLPKQLTQEEVESLVSEAIDELNAKSLKDIGIIMKAVMPKVQGRADGNMVNKAVKKLLSN